MYGCVCDVCMGECVWCVHACMRVCACIYVCVCACVIDGEGSWVFASTALSRSSMDSHIHLTSYSDYLTTSATLHMSHLFVKCLAQSLSV